MKDKTKGMIHCLIIALVVAGMLLITLMGFGKSKTGSISDVKLGLDLAGGVSITYETVKPDPTPEEIEDTRYKMQKRAEAFSTESAVYLEGNNRFNVDIPDVTDANAVLEKMGSAGSIYFIYGKSPNGIQNIEHVKDDVTGEEYYKLTRPIEEIIAAGDVVIDGSDISGAEPATDPNAMSSSRYVVQLKLNAEGTKKFADATTYAAPYHSNTTTNYENLIAIVYDGKIESAPGVQNAITGGEAQISGQRSFEEAKNLASVIRIGALPLELSVLRYNIVGAKLGAEAIDTSMLAGIIGFAMIIVFMLVMYRIQGLAADIALVLYVTLMVICLNLFNVTLTLPGIAGILLSIGMAVDANVIIFTRIQEELATGKTVRSSIKSGFSKAMSAIVDGNMTTIIAALVLYFVGSGTVKGFAQTLAIGIILSMITALFITKFILYALYKIGFDSVKFYGIKKAPKIFGYVKNFKKFICISGLLFVVGVAALIVNKSTTGEFFNYGLDFQGGTSTEVEFSGTLPENSELEDAILKALGVAPEIVKVEESNSVIIKTRELTVDERGLLSAMLTDKYGVDSALITTQSISSTVSGEMKRDAVLAVVIATIAMLIYIWIRFKNFNFAVSAILALVHDVVIVLMVYAVARNFISVGNTFIACMLTIVGYSINATIVIFDRIRENMKEKLKKESVADIVNLSISQTFSRSINTSLTTFIMIFMLGLLGVASIREFAIPLMAGVLCGAFSSVCLTGCIWNLLQKRRKTED